MLKPALIPVPALRILLSVPLAVLKVVNVTLVSCSMDRHVSMKLNVVAMTMEKHIRYTLPFVK